MTETAFVTNWTITNQFQDKIGIDPLIFVGPLLSDTMFHTDFRAMMEGNKPEIMRFYKYLGPKDLIDVKTKNIVSEERIVRQLHEAGVYEVLRDRTGCLIPNILQIGPREGGSVSFWKPEEAISYDIQTNTTHNYIGYQISDNIPGKPLSRLTRRERQNSELLEEVGRQIGVILAEFHHAAREVDLPRNETPETLATDHGYRYGVLKTAQIVDDLTIDETYRGLAAEFHADIEPEFAAKGKRETRTHGNVAMEMWSVIPSEKRITGLVNFTYARLSFRETDFRGLVLFPKALDASIAAYEKKAKELTGEDVKIDKALALKLAGTIHANSIYMQKFMRGTPIDTNDAKAGQRAQETVALSMVLNQLEKIDGKYEPYAETVRNDAALSRRTYPGLTYKIV